MNPHTATASPEFPAEPSPVERLAQSRERMRRYLLPPERPGRGEGPAASGLKGLAARANDWLDQFRSHPIAGAVIDAAMGWWSHHPLRSVADLGEAAAQDIAVPLVRRNPLAAVATAVVVGVVVARIRPWRWVIKPALFAGLTSQVVARLMREAPMDFIVSAMTQFTQRMKPAPAADLSPAPTAAVTPSGVDEPLLREAVAPPATVPS